MANGDRREYSRSAILGGCPPLQIICPDGSRSAGACIKDLSIKGMCMTHQKDFNIGESINLILSTDRNNEIHYPARIVWVKTHQSSQTSYNYGIEFLQYNDRTSVPLSEKQFSLLKFGRIIDDSVGSGRKFLHLLKEEGINLIEIAVRGFKVLAMIFASYIVALSIIYLSESMAKYAKIEDSSLWYEVIMNVKNVGAIVIFILLVICEIIIFYKHEKVKWKQ